MTIYEEVAKIVRATRRQSSLSQETLALISGVGKTAVFDIEKGKETVQLSTLVKVLEVLNISLILKPPF